jgi:hypothetical protein
MHGYGTLNLNGFVSDGRLLIKLQVRGHCSFKICGQGF